jgi:hypothetical protein
VKIRDQDDGVLLYSIEAASGPDMGNWTNFFKKMADKRVTIDRITVGEDSSLGVLEAIEEETGLSEAISYGPVACHVCSESTIVC